MSTNEVNNSEIIKNDVVEFNYKDVNFKISDSLRWELPHIKVPFLQRDQKSVLKVQKINFESNIKDNEKEEVKWMDKENVDVKVKKINRRIPDFYQGRSSDTFSRYFIYNF